MEVGEEQPIFGDPLDRQDEIVRERLTILQLKTQPLKESKELVVDV